MGRADDESSSTLRELAVAPRGRDGAPVLLIGSYLPGASRVVALDRAVTIGRARSREGRDRDRDVDVALPADDRLSRPHLRIAPRTEGWKVEDLGSSNGTFVDGRPVAKSSTALFEGNIVQFGGHAGVLRLASDEELEALEAEQAAPFGPVATLSPELALTLAALRRLARTADSLLFVGETGVGKEIYARAVHAASGRRGPFVAISCAALPAELAESELFGYERGAHSTATRAKPGRVEAAHGGTLLLDEIGDMPLGVQAKLFRFLQDGQVIPLGGTRPRRVDVRVVAATSRSPETLREDLLGRLGAEPIEIPPLRDRAEDIGALVAHFGGAALQPGMETAAFRALCLYHWPRNVRELAEAVKRALAYSGGGKIRVADLPRAVRAALESGPHIEAPRTYRSGPSPEKLERLLAEHKGNIAAVAKALGRRWNVIQRWLKKYGIEAGKYRG
jgi:transcriptional regulator with PAS, ATPase and Fis domain